MSWPIEDAGKRFADIVDKALKGEPQTLTEQGRPKVMIVSVEEYASRQDQSQASIPSLPDLLLDMPRGDDPFEREHVGTRDVDFECT